VAKEDLAEAVLAFEHFLRQRGFKVTRTRLWIAERALGFPGHFSAADLWGTLRIHGISMATIYRTLDLLEQADLIRRCTFMGTGARYESCLGHKHHGHFLCRRCGTIVEFDEGEVKEFLCKIADEHDFQLQQTVIQGFGLCAACRHAEREGWASP